MRSTEWVDDAATWWSRQRSRYNVGLIVSGVLAFICYIIALDRRIREGSIPHGAEITIFTTLFQAIGYLFMMAIANLCYSMGPLSESVVKPKDIHKYRRVTFAMGFWFSVLLPFTIPALVAFRRY